MTRHVQKQSEFTIQTPSFRATQRQQRATNPVGSFWVGASAGTGKTKVLIERVLRLLLPGEDGRPGTRPDQILCLTYTRAAAAEMTNRLRTRLSEWVILKESDLYRKISDIIGAEPTSLQMAAARKLFSQIVDGPAQIRIMTIHAFCLSVLARFPLEAGVAPNFTPIEDADVENMLQQARQHVFSRSIHEPVLMRSIGQIVKQLNDSKLGQILNVLLSERGQLYRALSKMSADQWPKVYLQAFNLPLDTSREKLARNLAALSPDIVADLSAFVACFSGGIADDKKMARGVQDWLEQVPSDRLNRFDLIENVFFTKAGLRRLIDAKKGVRNKNPEASAQYRRLGDWAETCIDTCRALDLIETNIHLLRLAQAILNEYEQIKRQKGVLDFEDQIWYTLGLLKQGVDQPGQGAPMLSWVMFKLDEGIDHILLDESQDTNPEQWEIVRILAHEFFVGRSADDEKTRTIFVVGDVKQSIYSFQRADPDSFRRSLAEISEQARRVQIKIEEVALDVSFRSTEPVLHLVDRVFEEPESYADLGANEPISHVISRMGQAGQVTLWPRQVERKKDDSGAWDLPLFPTHHVNERTILARDIARTIRGWLDRGDMLPARGRKIQPGDIMILVRKRAPFLPLLLAALRAEHVPVGGLDRMQIMASIAVQDILALAKFALTPDDDLTLATVLKTPLIGLDDDDLMAVCHGRVGTVWDSMQGHLRYSNIVTYLNNLIVAARTGDSYMFLYGVIYGPCPADTHSGLRAMAQRLSLDVQDPIQELLNLALQTRGAATGLRGFILDLEKTNPDVKRDISGSDNVVKLMTVHASKGLESPIVILPDTIQSGGRGHRVNMYWSDYTGCPLPIWVPRQGESPDMLRPIMAQVAHAQKQESLRLLYVALTRAQDRLLIAGVAPLSSAPNSWYDLVCSGFGKLETLPGFSRTPTENGDILHYESQQTEKPDCVIDSPVPVPVVKTGETDDLLILLPPEPSPARPLRPERPSGHDSVSSPLALAVDPYRFLRGTITHKLLQILPDIDPVQRQFAARAYVGRAGVDLDMSIRAEIVTEVLSVLNHPEFGPIFGPGSWAEVPITGMTAGGRLISGQIDRLLVTDRQILVIDFKTNRPPPSDVGDVSAAYIHQLQAYRDLLVRIYPDRVVRCALLWTDGPRLMVFDHL